jgi:hypothetical protein
MPRQLKRMEIERRKEALKKDGLLDFFGEGYL